MLSTDNKLTKTAKEKHGYKQPVTVHLSKTAYDILIRENGHKDNDFSAIMEKAILNLSDPAARVITEIQKAEDELKKIKLNVQKFIEESSDEYTSTNQQLKQEVSKRIQAEKLLEEYGDRFKSVLEHSYDVLYRANLNTGEFEYISPSLKRMLGYNSMDGGLSLVGFKGMDPETHPIRAFIHPDDYQKVFDYFMGIRNAATSKEIDIDSIDSTVEFRVKHRDSSYRWVCNTYTIVFDERNMHVDVVGSLRDITKRRQAEEKLQKLYNKLEAKVKERTSELEEANLALTYVLKKMDKDKATLEEQILLNMKELVKPTLENLKRSNSDSIQKKHIDILESNLNHITSPFSCKLTSKYLNLTHGEIKIANLIMNGKTTKEISGMLNLSARTIDFHRLSIRKKIGITNKKKNLRSHLITLQ